MTQKTIKIPCDWCGKPSEVNWQGETLCDNCWNWICLEAEKKKNDVQNIERRN